MKGVYRAESVEVPAHPSFRLRNPGVTAGCDALKSLTPSSDLTRSSSYAVCAPQADPRLRVGSSFAFFIPKPSTEYVKFLKGSS